MLLEYLGDLNQQLGSYLSHGELAAQNPHVAVEAKVLDQSAHDQRPGVVAITRGAKKRPRLFDLGTIAYWRAPRGVLGNAGIEEIRKVTQCVFELSDKQLRVVKAEGHSSTVQGRLFRVLRDEETIRLHAGRAIGRLAQGLRTVRSERSLTQADLARLAEVSSSALSQAETGQRGLSLDTLLTLTSRLRIGLDDLVDNAPSQDYVLARRDRGAELGASKFLLDDPSAGLRVYLVALGPGRAANATRGAQRRRVGSGRARSRARRPWLILPRGSRWRRDPGGQDSGTQLAQPRPRCLGPLLDLARLNG